MAAGGDAIVAIATPPGRGAIGIVRLSGAGCLALASRFLRLGDIALEPRAARLAWAYDEDRPLDRTLITYFPAGASYTGEEMLEISAHGSPYVLERLVELCRLNGARLAAPGEFTQRAFLNGRLDLTQAEAVCDLIQARTHLAHRTAIARLEGGLSRRVTDLRARLLELRARIEAALDHPEEDIPALTGSEALNLLDSLSKDARALACGLHRGRLAENGPRIAILGRPNAGKSSLLNALVGFERAIVSDVAGTTRDTIEHASDLGGLEAVLIDTAGLRERCEDPLERLGMERAQAALRGSDLALFVLDRTVPLELSRAALGEIMGDSEAQARPVIAVLNKCDAPIAACTPRDLRRLREDLDVAEVSARLGTGLEALIALIRGRLGGDPGEQADCALMPAARHQAALEDCARELDEARAALQAGSSRMEIAGACLLAATNSLDEITGATTTEDLLSEIFSRFCVGK